MAAIFWISLLLVLYHHVGYPCALRVIVKARGQRHLLAIPRQSRPREAPAVTIVVPAHNEARVIADKIANLSDLEYPPDKLQIVLALDGCADLTEERATAALGQKRSNRQIALISYPTNIGKIAVLNDQVAKVTSEIVGLTDASAIVCPDALLRAAAHFADASVGVVAGTYSVTETAPEGEQAYWQHQTRIKIAEAALGSPMGVHGAFYLFRRSLWAPLPADTINDDFVLPMRIVLQGYRAVYDPTIVAIEKENARTGQDFWRRMRIGAGNLQQFVRLWRLANPRHGWVAFIFVSGKGLRALTPLLLIAVLLSSGLLAANGGTAYGIVFAGLVAALILALLPDWSVDPVRSKTLERLRYAVRGYSATALGALLCAAGCEQRLWSLSRLQKGRLNAVSVSDDDNRRRESAI